jgi:hypothetical protein
MHQGGTLLSSARNEQGKDGMNHKRKWLHKGRGKFLS